MTQVPPSKPLTHFKLLAFDIYGTLIDWEDGIMTAFLSSPAISRLPADHPLKSRDKLALAFDHQERAIQLEQPGLEYSLMLAEVYRRILKQASVDASDEEIEKGAQDFAGSIGTWPAFPDTVAAMQTLKKHYRLVPLSNVDNASFARTLAGPLKGVDFDAIYTAQDIGSYKPSHANFEYLFSHAKSDFGIEKDQILQVAQSLHHDHVPATETGMETGVWVARKDGEMGAVSQELKDKARFGWKVATLGELADLVEGEFAKQ